MSISARTHILFVEHKDSFGGGQVFLLNLVERLDGGQFACHVVSSLNPRLSAEMDQRGIDYSQISLGRIRKSGNPIIIAANIFWRIVPTVRLYRCVKKYGIRLICANDVYSFLSCLAAARIARLPILLIVHNISYPRSFFTSYIIKEASAIVAVSRSVKQHLIALEPGAEEKVRVICNGIELPAYRTSESALDVLRKSWNLPADHLLIGAVGRISKEKGLDYLIKAVPFVLKHHPSTRFVILGEGPEEMHLKQMCRELDVTETVIFAGFQKHVRDALRLVDIFVMPSLAEGMPLALLEAMSMEKPIVAAAVGGVLEILSHNETGLLISPADSEELTRAIVSLIENPEERKRLGHNARELVVKSFTSERMVGEYVDVLRSMLGNHQ